MASERGRGRHLPLPEVPRLLEAAGRVVAPVPTRRSRRRPSMTDTWKLIALRPGPAAVAISDEDMPARLLEFKQPGGRSAVCASLTPDSCCCAGRVLGFFNRPQHPDRIGRPRTPEALLGTVCLKSERFRAAGACCAPRWDLRTRSGSCSIRPAACGSIAWLTEHATPSSRTGGVPSMRTTPFCAARTRQQHVRCRNTPLRHVAA
jgi:hypothetical protein